VNAIAEDFELNNSQLLWVVIEHETGPADSEFADAFMTDFPSRMGLRAGDLDTLPTAGAIGGSPERTAPGYFFVVRRADMMVTGARPDNETTAAEFLSEATSNLPEMQESDACMESSGMSCNDGILRVGEACDCNDDCLTGYLCTQNADGDGVCAPNCSGDQPECGLGFACVLSSPESADGVAPGTCYELGVGEIFPVGSTCDRDSDCSQGLCLASSAVGRRICRSTCDDNSECSEGYECYEGVCLGSSSERGIGCAAPSSGSDDDTDDASGGCQNVPPSNAALYLLLLGLVFAGRRRIIQGPV